MLFVTAGCWYQVRQINQLNCGRSTSTKLAFVDSGIAAHQIGADARSLRRPSGQLGGLLEGFVLMEIARQLSWSDEEVELFHYRTRDQVEVDAVLENRRGEVVGIEVKAGLKMLAVPVSALWQTAA
ncbi:DUF4143 domain-containing protein [Nocardia sp. NPDC056064]|uniref:DUF4143 domain-containing protein n=1 Tax=Nocardia sp. NPDC056064 TaxID=3345701 RepID=UPI0035DED1CE